MMENRISGLKCDTDVFITFEGDNAVMLPVRFRKYLFLNGKFLRSRAIQKSEEFHMFHVHLIASFN